MRYAFTTFVFIALVWPIYGQDKSSNPTSHKERADKLSQPIPQPPSQAVNVINERVVAKEKESAKNHSEGYLRRLLSPENIPNIVLALVGITGIVIAICTLKTIQRQTGHIATQAQNMRSQTTHLKNSVEAAKEGTSIAKTSADAAKASADAVINSERARIVIEFVQKAAIYGGQWHRIEPYGPVLLTTEEVLKGKHLNYELKITNIGRTPAELFELEIGWGALIEGKQFFAEELPSQQTRSVNEFWGAGESRSMYSFNSMETFDRTLNGDQKGVIYATIKYGDTVSDEARRQHSSFVLYHCGNSRQPLSRINTQTKYT